MPRRGVPLRFAFGPDRAATWVLVAPVAAYATTLTCDVCRQERFAAAILDRVRLP
jgi:hypothetical protein